MESQLTLKWVGVAAAIWVQAFAGGAYTFANFSPRLKSVLGYSQIQLNNLAVAKDVGESVGLLSGYLSNKLPAWSLLCIAALEALLGYGVLWLVISGRLLLPYSLMCLVICVAANSSTFFNTAVLVTVMRNFPQSRGTVAGILKGFAGLSGAIFTQIYISFLAKDPVSLVLLLAVSPLAVSLVSMYFIRPVPGASRDPEEKPSFYLVYLICIFIALYLLVIALVEDFIPVKSQAFNTAATIVMFLLLIAPILVSVKFFRVGFFKGKKTESPQQPLLAEEFDVQFNEEECAQQSYPYGDEEQLENDQNTGSLSESASATSLSEDEELENDHQILMAVGEGAIPLKPKPRRGEDFNMRQAVLKADFWLLFFTFFCGIGSGVTAINNFGQMGQAQGYSDVTVFITLIGIWNFLGRLAGGAISEKYVRRAVPRTVWLAGAQALMTLAHLCFAWGGPGSLHVGSTILGICYGFHSVLVPTASELFGLKHFGKIYNLLTMGDPFASLLFSGFVAGYLYDAEAKKEPDRDYCYGAHCFRKTFLLMALVCVVGMLASIVVSVRIKPVYESLYEKKKQQKESQGSKPVV